MTRIPVLLFLLLMAGCNSGENTYDYQNHRFDQQVIQKLPVYDSLSSFLIRNFPLLQKDLAERNSLLFERYEGDHFQSKNLPPEVVNKINGYITQLGKNFISGISVYKDSSIRYDIRDTYLERYYLNVRERLSYFPKGGNKKKLEPPHKDTMLNNNWQYWILFDEQSFF